MIEAGLDYGGRPYRPIPLMVTDGVSEVLFCPNCRDMIIQIMTLGIGVLGSFTFTVEGSLDGFNFGNLSASDSTTEVSTNKTTILTYDGAVPPYIQVSVASSALLSASASYVIYAAFGVLS